MIDIEQIRELLKLMTEHDLGEIRIREGETAIALRKSRGGEPVIYSAAAPGVMPVAAPAAPAVAPATMPAQDEGLIPITSPMVGTVYLSPDPESPPYATAGREVDAASPICIIEAMKVFNEIRAEISGVIERVLVQSEQAVEFGQPLMLVRPKG
ncbi:MAG TPA: acetyl-CoA carboxylase biotin carboxyl carrier protein [Phycisphaerae bacterium]|nr:acetyl-CoA carboxylase biotin carboxyl carrier protein [Phycisphaerae bacterium]